MDCFGRGERELEPICGVSEGPTEREAAGEIPSLSLPKGRDIYNIALPRYYAAV